ncbi:MAG TPA: ATP-binding protein [Tepidisphaeraceae bacterium]|nr:ATP-binding protein [Tepidisphaeraceae bacterium]
MKLSIKSDPAELAPVRKSVEAFCAENGFGEHAVGEIGLCVNEAIANIIRHAYHGEIDQPIEIEATIEADKLHVKIRDWGEGNKPNMQVTKSKDPLKPGGLGLICMGRLMDKVAFTPQSIGMLLEMFKKK